MKKVSIGCDHGAYDLKNEIIKHYQGKYEFIDVGCYSTDSIDYPDYAIPAAELVAKGEVAFGIVLCKSGIGVSIAANKVKGVRCALVDDTRKAMLCHAHNNANVIAMGANDVDINLAIQIIDIYDSTEFEIRHQKRLDKISAYENGK